MKKQIIRRAGASDVEGGSFADGLHPVLARAYRARELSSPDQLDYSLKNLSPASLLGGIDHAVELLYRHLSSASRIVVIGDFDADGATSCALAVRALGSFGADQVRYLVPNRFAYGYGLTPEIVAVAREHDPDLIITVDNGVSSHEGVLAAKAAGIDVLITDHHLPGETLPAADAIVNPNLSGDPFPSKHLAGVGVIFYVMMALRAALRDRSWFDRKGIAEPNLAQWLDLVALGTIADVVALDYNNRILVSQGLARIRAGQCCQGIRALLEGCGRNHRRVVAADLGFALGPRLNAAGRIEDMSLGIACLLSDEPAQARALAARLDVLNLERREIEAQMQAEAMTYLAEMPLEPKSGQFSVCLFAEQWHQGVVGLLASRIKDRFHRPTVVFAPADDHELKGSARSIPGLHIRDAFAGIAARHPGLLPRFGGHAMAAGLSLRREDLARFQQAFEEEVRHRLCSEDLQGYIVSDGEVEADHLSLELAEQLRFAGPWGQGFPEPVFDGEFRVRERRPVGDRHLRLLLQPKNSSRCIQAIAFNTDETRCPGDGQEVHIAYRLDVSEFRGSLNPQLIVEHIV